MLGRFGAAAVLAVLTASPLAAQHAPLSVCLVQTKSDAAIEYDPPAGPWAVAVDTLLDARKLRSGALLRITVLAATTEKDVLPEVRRLPCAWVVQLRDHPSFWPGGRYETDDEDTVLFSLWNSATGKVMAQGAALVAPIPGQARFHSSAMYAAPSAALSRQILQSLNKIQ